MGLTRVEFRYETGLSRSPFIGASLTGSWTDDGHATSGPWTSVPMQGIVCEDGTPGFAASVEFQADAAGQPFSWGVQLEHQDGSTAWGIFAETPADTLQYRSFTVAAAPDSPQLETYRLSWHRCRGAQRFLGASEQIRFSVWAPNAQQVEVVFGGASGYIADDGYGQDPALAPIELARSPADNEIWEATREGFDQFVGRRYLFRIIREDGSVNWATDMFSREQCGEGTQDPGGEHFDGTPAELDGRPSCSEVVDLGLVGPYPAGAPAQPEADFWADEHLIDRHVATSVADLVIYELHIGALNPQSATAGTFADAIALLPYLESLGINAIELMPMLQFDGTLSWGYGSSHFLAIESAAGGRDALKHFVKACHRHGIAVIMDVVYNHYTPQAARAAWQYDSAAAHDNIYYWYEGTEQDYSEPDGGYLDNVSSGWAPRYHDQHVRALFVSSAVCLLDEFHIDGLRVDQTASIHQYNALHANGSPVPNANIWGRKFLRELCQTLKTVWPDSLLIAEDHSHWAAVTEPAAGGGVGFDATWYVDFFHHLVGETSGGPEWAKLLLGAAADQSSPLHVDWFAGAEARCRFACGMSMLSAGTPMFLMGEEIGAQRAYTYDKFQENKEDLEGQRRGTGARLFRFYQDVIALRASSPTLRSTNVEVVHADNDTRVLAFRRWDEDREYVIAGSLNNTAFDQPGYRIAHPALVDATWAERFNSDAPPYGGNEVGNPEPLQSAGGAIELVIPANGVVVLERAV